MNTNKKETELSLEAILFQFEHQRKLGTFRSKIAAQSIKDLFNELVGEDEKHWNGKKLVNPNACDECGIPEEAYTRNQLRAELRKKIEELK